LISDGNGIAFIHRDVTTMTSFGPFVYFLMFCVGMPPYVMKNIATIFNNSRKAKYLVAFHSPNDMKYEFGFDIDDMGIQYGATMSGSGESKTCYFFKRSLVNVESKEKKDFCDEDSLYEIADFAVSSKNNFCLAITNLDVLTHEKNTRRVGIKKPTKYGSWIK